MFPSLPAYSGPYQVGTIELEAPVSDLSCPAPPPKGFRVATLKTRFFYPCRYPEKRPKPAYWVPDPQQEYLEGFAAFLGASNKLAKAIAYSSYFVRSARIPAFSNAPLLSPPTKSRRWPVLVFSHGLGGSRNTYSQICGSIASHGVVVAAPEHRDGSGPISFITDKDGKQTSVPFRRIPFAPSPEAYEKRSEQLRIRLWELGALHQLLLRLDEGQPVSSPLNGDTKDAEAALGAFKSRLEVHKPGTITWAGHSFGAASVIQFVKSVSYGAPSAAPKSFRPLYAPGRASSLVGQITPSSPVILQDPWSYALHDPATAWLHEQPMPSYRSSVGGANILVLLSEAFYKWEKNLNATKEAISPPPTASPNIPHPRLFYAAHSAHLSQSDFGVLFPLLTRLVFKAQDPERTIRLNTRAIMEVMRRAGIEVARTTDLDMELPGAKTPKKGTEREQTSVGRFSDQDILSPEGKVRGWTALGLKAEPHAQEGVTGGADESAKPVDGELEN